MSGDGKIFNGKIFNAENAQKKALNAVGNIKEGVNTVRNSETFQNLSNKGAVGFKKTSDGMSNVLDSTNMVGNKQQRVEYRENFKKKGADIASGLFARGKSFFNNLEKEGKDRRNQQVAGRKTKKSRRNKRKSTRKTRKNKRKTKKSKKSKRKSRKTRRK